MMQDCKVPHTMIWYNMVSCAAMLVTVPYFITRPDWTGPHRSVSQRRGGFTTAAKQARAASLGSGVSDDEDDEQECSAGCS